MNVPMVLIAVTQMQLVPMFLGHFHVDVKLDFLVMDSIVQVCSPAFFLQNKIFKFC